jgi:hypothetical protein
MISPVRALVAQTVASIIVSSVVYDGLTFYTSPTATMTGKLRIYGFHNG